jgi:hydroxymethylpyrimidine pyrophosphatase-like HAD family hydrolase
VVAVSFARPKLKALADYVTDDIFHDGILHAMEYLQLI